MTMTKEMGILERRMRELTEELGSMKADEVDLDAVERRVQEMANAWGRMQMAVAMKRADSEASEVDIKGQRWGNRREHGHDYETVFGPVALERGVYQQSGRGRVAVPMDLRLGIVEGTYTPRLARIASRALASMPEHEAAELLAEVGTATLSNSTIGRLSRAIAARYEQSRPIIAGAVREQHPIAEQAVTVQVGLDGVMVPQDGEHARLARGVRRHAGLLRRRRRATRYDLPGTHARALQADAVRGTGGGAAERAPRTPGHEHRLGQRRSRTAVAVA